jgi:hypothetical protein
MRNDRHLAIKLRKEGKSYNKISTDLGIPKSTMHYWFKNLLWSKKIKRNLTERATQLAIKRMKIISQSNKRRWELWRKQFRINAKAEFNNLKGDPLFIAGLMLYWGEGDGNMKNEVRMANIDPRMIKLFNEFLIKICRVNKEEIYASLTLYPDLREETCKIFWSRKTKIHLKQFSKSQFIYGKHPTKRLENGICTIKVRKSRGLKEKIFVWISLLSKNLANSL